MKAVEKITARGHENIVASHKKTFEITKDYDLSERGDCIIAVKADKSVEDLNDEFKNIMRRENAKLTIVFQVGNQKEVVEAWGNPKLTFNHPADLVVRKSDYTCPRTLAIKANKSAEDLSRHFVANLKNFQRTINVILVAEATD